jgi:hypothetical protein
VTVDDTDFQHVGWWVQAGWPDELRVLRSAIAAEVVISPPLPDADEIERSIGPMLWLLERCADGVTLTQSGYLPPSLVVEAVQAFDWWPFGGRPRSEADVFQLDLLRMTARRLRLLFRRGRRLSTSSTGRRLLADPAALWRSLNGRAVSGSGEPGLGAPDRGMPAWSSRERVRAGRCHQPLGHPVPDMVEAVFDPATVELDRCAQ